MKMNLSKLLIKPNYMSYFIISFVIVFNSCKKLISIPEPINSVTTTEVFGTEALASTAINGIYSNLSYNDDYATNRLSSFTGCSSDEINSTDPNLFQTNSLLADDGVLYSTYWTPMYNTIYECNAVMEGLAPSNNISTTAKQNFRGQALFLRAFSYFYLVNLFGDVPLVTTTSFANNALIPRTPISQVYDQIITDLKEAQSILPADLQSINGQSTRVYANKYAATALLSRVYLYRNKWAEAEVESSKVIANSATFQLVSDLNKVFLADSKEAIWQLQMPDKSRPWTIEGGLFIPYDNTTIPPFFLTDGTAKSFEPGDARFTAWVGTSIIGGNTYLYPFKYKVKQYATGTITEYYNMLRLSEQYLIRAESRAQQGAAKLNDAVADLNVIRARAGLVSLSSTGINQAGVLAAVAQENRIEFFAEMGHRWFDLKRTNKVNDVLAPLKGSNWQATDQLYPIPYSEILVNSKLVQNPGY